MKIRDFFALQAKCSICGENANLNRFKTKDDGWVCCSCYKKKAIGYKGKVKNMTIEEIRNMEDYKKTI